MYSPKGSFDLPAGRKKIARSMKTQPHTQVEAMIELIKVSKVYPPDIVALKDVSVSIGRGEMFFIIGRSGAGKTTLLKLLYNMDTVSNGLIEIGQQPISRMRGYKLAKLRQKIGVAYQDFKLLLDRTTAENIAISMEVSYKKPQNIKKRGRDLLHKLALTDKHAAITGELSRGEQQRVALARAVANSPTLILVDEPTGNLDPELSREIMELFLQFNQVGVTLLIATHDVDLVNRLGKRIINLRNGRVAGDTGDRD